MYIYIVIYIYIYIIIYIYIYIYKIIRLIFQPLTFYYITDRLYVLSFLLSYIYNIYIYIYTYIYIYIYIYICIYTNLKRHNQNNTTHTHFNLILNPFKLIKMILFRWCCYYRYNKIGDLKFITCVGTQRKKS